MHLHITTIVFLIFEHINKVFTQSAPMSPCPKMFQYRFDGTEWFGMLSVRNPDFGQPLQLRVILSLRGKPTTNYLGEIELLTRGQFLSDAPVLYKVKFPRSPFPPKLLQIATNNQVICLGAGDHSIFVTQIQLEHTRKFTFIPGDMQPPPPPLPPPSPPTDGSASSLIPFPPDTSGLDLGGGQPASASTAMKDLSNLPFDGKHLPSANPAKKPMTPSEDICGTIDDRIRFQALHALRQTSSPSSAYSSSRGLTNLTDNIHSMLSSTLLSRQSDEGSMGAKTRDTKRNSEDEAEADAVTMHSPPLVTTDTDYDYDTDAALANGTVQINKLPSIMRGAWPWLAAIYVNNATSLTYQCGGTLVSERIVITAAHCFQLLKQRYTSSEVLVFLGRHNLRNWNEEGSVAAPVDDIFIHSDYNAHLSSYDADIAVVILKYKVRFNTFIRPACLWSGSPDKESIEGAYGVVAGWGLGGFNTSRETLTTTLVPKIITTPIVSNDVCFEANPSYRSISSNRTFCAGIIKQEHLKTKLKSDVDGKPASVQGPCAGDSGGGLMIFKSNRWMLRGTVSGLLLPQSSDHDAPPSTIPRQTQTCSINQYVIYTDVAEYLDWIFAFLI